jgi:hypothetical protein
MAQRAIPGRQRLARPWGIALALVVPLLVAGLLQVALDQPLWGFVGLLFDIVVLFWCWGPRDLDLDVAADPRCARCHLAPRRRGTPVSAGHRCRGSMVPRWSRPCSAMRSGAGSACCSGSACWARSARCCIA